MTILSSHDFPVNGSLKVTLGDAGAASYFSFALEIEFKLCNEWKLL